MESVRMKCQFAREYKFKGASLECHGCSTTSNEHSKTSADDMNETLRVLRHNSSEIVSTKCRN
eukprot:scaffold341934_cov34-Prasinocladus_malaysianus.AAC.1